MGFRAGVRSAVTSLTASLLDDVPLSRTLDTSAMLGPYSTELALGSPWADSSALHSIVLPEIFGDGLGELLPVTRAEAIQVPAVARARGLVCNTIARLDLAPVDRDGNPVTTDEHVQFLRQPDPAQSRYIMLTWTFDDMFFHGVSWWIVRERYASGNVRVAQRIIPGGVVLEDGGKVKVYGREVDPTTVKRFDGPHEGMLNSASRSIRMAAQMERNVNRFSRDPVPAIELHQTDDHPMTDKAVKALIQQWVDARRSVNGQVAYTPRNVEAKIHGVPAENLLLAGRNASAIDVARHAGVPADALDASLEHASMTYGNVESKGRVLVDYGMASYAEALTARLSMNDLLPNGVQAEFDFKSLTAVAEVGTPDANSGAPSA